MAAKLKTKRTSITTMGAKIQAFDIFQTPLSSHNPLPLIYIFSSIYYQCLSPRGLQCSFSPNCAVTHRVFVSVERRFFSCVRGCSQNIIAVFA
jgi:hypothetical protein